MKTWAFTITITGMGNNEKDAWDDAVEQFMLDCDFNSDLHESKIINEEAELEP